MNDAQTFVERPQTNFAKNRKNICKIGKNNLPLHCKF